jgi:hypothetical protein
MDIIYFLKLNPLKNPFFSLKKLRVGGEIFFEKGSILGKK